MNFFLKNRFVSLLLIFLVLVNLTVLATFLVFYLRKTDVPDPQSCRNTCMSFSRELGLSSSQSEKVEVILSAYRSATGPVTDEIRNYRTQLLEELAKDQPDTLQLNRYVDEIYRLQKQMQNASVKQYMALKEICNPDQCRRLSALYFELYGCPGKAMGKGMMHQNRRGQGQNGCGNMPGKDS
jgi:hypothetical protein